MPFGGFKQSGMGRELGEYALSKCVNFSSILTPLLISLFSYTNVKSVHINLGAKMI
jgi:acyl-CoA reductase-like NAD-dependent aldehyde dehydrogenase